MVIPIGIMLLLNALPLTANALLLNNTGTEGLFLPVPRQLIPTSHNSTSNSNIQSKSISNSNIQSKSILNSDSFPCTSSNLNIHNNSNSYYYNNLFSWASKNRYGNPCIAISPFLNIPKNLIVPECPQNSTQCPAIVGTQRGDIIIATNVFSPTIFGLGGNDIIECGPGNCKVFTAFGNNVLMSGPAQVAQLYGGSGGYSRPGNNIFIGAGGETLMVGGRGNDQFYAGSNLQFDGGNDIMIGGSGANYFDCGSGGNGVILDFNPAKGDTKAPDCKYVISVPSANIFGGPDLLPGILRGFNASHANETNASHANETNASHTNETNASNGTSVVTAHTRVRSP
ncbi:MAG: calcium-binding protein [Candidatus Nitrosopolaris sp.]